MHNANRGSEVFLTRLFAVMLLLSTLFLAFHVVYHIPIFYSAAEQTYGQNYWPKASEFIKFIDSTSQPSFWNELTAEEQVHMHDVARIFVYLRLLTLACVSITGLLFVFSQDKLKLVKKGSITAALILVVLTILTTTFFKQIFLGMHKLLFTNNFWLLPSDTTLIQLFPEQTFFIIGLVTLLSTFLFLILLFATIKFAEKNATNANKRKTKRRV